MALKIDDRVRCRYFNRPELKYYGPNWEATVVKIVRRNSTFSPGIYRVRRDSGTVVTIQHKEIKKVLERRGEG